MCDTHFRNTQPIKTIGAHSGCRDRLQITNWLLIWLLKKCKSPPSFPNHDSFVGTGPCKGRPETKTDKDQGSKEGLWWEAAKQFALTSWHISVLRSSTVPCRCVKCQTADRQSSIIPLADCQRPQSERLQASCPYICGHEVVWEAGAEPPKGHHRPAGSPAVCLQGKQVGWWCSKPRTPLHPVAPRSPWHIWILFVDLLWLSIC